MRIHLGFNQVRAKELGIEGVNRAIIFDYLCSMSSWAEGLERGGEIWYWVSRKKVSEDLGMMGLRGDTIYRHFCGLRDIGLIKYEKVGRKDVLRLTDRGRSYLVGKSEIDPSLAGKSEMNPSLGLKVGNKSELKSEINPTYSIKKKKDSIKRIRREGDKVFLWDKYLMNGGEELVGSLQEYFLMREKKKKPLVGERGRSRFRNELMKLSGGRWEAAVEVLDQSTYHGWVGLFAVKGNGGDISDSFVSRRELL